MSIKSRILAATAALTVVGGLGTVGALSASAATPPCGHRCIDIFSREFGTHHQPELRARRVARVGQGRHADHPVPHQQHRQGRGLHRLLPGHGPGLLQRRPGVVRAEPALLAQLGVRVRVLAERREQRPVHRHREHRRQRHAGRAGARAAPPRRASGWSTRATRSGAVTCR